MPHAASTAGAETRGKILRAAAELICEVGWSGVTTRRVAERAGVNVALPNYYFGSKAALLVEAAEAALREEVAEAFRRIGDAASPIEAVRAAIGWIHEMDATAPNITVGLEAMVQSARDRGVGEMLRSVMDGYLGYIAGLLRAARDRGELPRQVDPEGLSIALAALIDGLMLYRVVNPDLPLDRAARAVGALLAPPAGRSGSGDNASGGWVE